jgi:hypothetical protein
MKTKPDSNNDKKKYKKKERVIGKDLKRRFVLRMNEWMNE